jgi:hypothetical protein
MIRAETVGLDVPFWFMSDTRYSQPTAARRADLHAWPATAGCSNKESFNPCSPAPFVSACPLFGPAPRITGECAAKR